jgi:ABC-type transport system substrate-binding protein
MRQAVAYCLERGELAQNIFFNLVDVPNAFAFSYKKTIPELVEGSSITNEIENSLIPNPAKGRELLSQSGWVDENEKDDLPRTAQGVNGIPVGQELSINYLVKDDKLSLAAANQVKTSLTECGFQVNLIAAAPEVFWDSDSPESILRGNYHLVQLDWELPIENPCPLFASQNIPQESNDYKGLNFSGFSNSEVDAMCEQMGVMSLSADKQDRLDRMEAIINRELAVIPLYISADLMVARNDFCAASTANAQSELVKIEEFAYGVNCEP